MPGPVAGMFFYLYLIVDIFSRKIVGWEVHERESADLVANLIRQAVLAEGCFMQPLVLHADNGSPMKGATMKTTMEKLGITASYSRPRVSNDNPFSEALFRTCKYRPDWPTKGFAVASCGVLLKRSRPSSLKPAAFGGMFYWRRRCRGDPIPSWRSSKRTIWPRGKSSPVASGMQTTMWRLSGREGTKVVGP
jgi:transposase InsO family protein